MSNPSYYLYEFEQKQCSRPVIHATIFCQRFPLIANKFIRSIFHSMFQHFQGMLYLDSVSISTKPQNKLAI